MKGRRCLKLLLFIFLGFFLSSCAYFAPSILPKHIRTISIPIFKNRTIRYGLEGILSDAIIKEFIIDGRLEVKRGNTDAILLGEIVQYSLEPLFYSSSDPVREYKVWVIVKITLKDLVTDKLLLQDQVIEGSGTYFSANPGGIVESEQDGIAKASLDLAKKVVSRVIEGW